MNIINFVFIILVSLFAALIRLYIDNNFLISIIGSFFFGFIIAKKLNQSINAILLTGFCSCFTSFTGFIYFIYKLTYQKNFITAFFSLNIIIILNLLMMYLGFQISRKIA